MHEMRKAHYLRYFASIMARPCHQWETVDESGNVSSVRNSESSEIEICRSCVEITRREIFKCSLPEGGRRRRERPSHPEDLVSNILRRHSLCIDQKPLYGFLFSNYVTWTWSWLVSKILCLKIWKIIVYKQPHPILTLPTLNFVFKL